jgi:diaminopimelate decarboxylase
MQEFSYHGDRLKVEDVFLEEAARLHGTPLYLYSRRSIVDHCRHIEAAFGDTPHLTCYAVKANGNGTILKIIAGEGLGADVVSGGELQMALAAGFPAERITFSSVGKRDEEMAAGLHAGIRAFNAESRQELEVLNAIACSMNTMARVMLRVNLDLGGDTHPYLSTGRQADKFGIPKEDLPETMRWAGALTHLDIRGLHTHLGSQIVDAEKFLRAAHDLTGLVGDVRRAGLPVAELDFGGGFGVQYHGYLRHSDLPLEDSPEQNLSAATIVRSVLPILRTSGCGLTIQPGRSIMAHAGVLIVRVLYRKQAGSKVFIVVDGGMNDLLRPSLYGAHHQVVPLRLEHRPHECVDVVGPLCESGDFLALNRKLPAAQRGDLLAVMCTGAYGYVLSSNYNARPRPAEVLADGDRCTVIRSRETVEDLIS